MNSTLSLRRLNPTYVQRKKAGVLAPPNNRWNTHERTTTKTQQQIKRAGNGCYDGRRAKRTEARRWSETAHTFLVLDLGLDVADGVAALDLERDRLPRQCLDEDLHLDPPSWDRSLAGGSGWCRGGVVNW